MAKTFQAAARRERVLALRYNCIKKREKGVKMKIRILLFASILILITTTNFAQEKISANDAANYIGKSVTVVDTVSSVYLSKTGTYFINMGGQYPDNDFTAVIFKRNTLKFSNVESLEGKVIEVSGKVKEYRGRPEIVVNNKKQIKVKK